jgi:hypothetical protein
MPAAVLPAGPLLERVRGRGGFRACAGADPALEKAYQRAQSAGRLTVWAADQLAVKVLGLPPVLVWGDAWWLDDQRPVDVSATPRRTNCRPGWRPCRRRHEHASVSRAPLT